MSADRIYRLVLTLAVIVAALGCVAGLLHVATIITLRVPLDPNEGWNAYFASAAIANGTPYPQPASLMTNNYPPLSFYLVGALSAGGDAIITGRIVSLISFLAVVGCSALAAIRMGCSRLEASFAALLLAVCLMLTSDYVGMNDPQLLGHALQLAALLVVLQEPRTPRGMVIAAALFTISLFMKHNLFILPAAIAVWLALLNRRLALTFVASGIVFSLIGMGIFKQVFGTNLLTQLNAPRTYSLDNAGTVLEVWLTWSAVPLAGLVMLLFSARRDIYITFGALYAVAATVVGALLLSGAGVDMNALFDADIALCLCTALLLGRTHGRWRPLIPWLYLASLAPVIWQADANWKELSYWLHPLRAEADVARSEIEYLRKTQGRAMCEMLSLCYWSGKPAEADLFNLGQQFASGTRSDGPLVAAIRSHAFSVIELEAPSDFRPTANVSAALSRSYRVGRKDDDRVFLIPR